MKEAYEFFERKYVPEKYTNSRQNFSFEEETEKTEFESIREKKKKQNVKQNYSDENKESAQNFQFNSQDETNQSYFESEELKYTMEKRKNIDKFLFIGIPVPRSDKMVDRLKLNKITISKGKILGPDDYFSFTVITILIVLFFLERKYWYKTYNLENLENVNIYNALKPSEVVKIYEENEISPSEQFMSNTQEHLNYEQRQNNENLKNEIISSTKFRKINDVPKIDIKKKFNESLK